MRPVALVSALAFVIGCTIGLLQTGCDTCDCPEPPARPTASAPLPGLQVTHAGEAGPTELEVEVEAGKLAVTGDTVVISYLQEGVAHEVTYRVTGPTVGPW
jgi:hypothetical protein